MTPPGFLGLRGHVYFAPKTAEPVRVSANADNLWMGIFAGGARETTDRVEVRRSH